ncbi:hypothetical protein M422DRAFT_37144 [Sphaerobolus stellatus SS14]|uniref:Uncharacterized protein n=1 Tax=Sphaerobolus stellatus (strain SS14) TaxID=990650 RepID=A0A0C9UUF5_SPHS4|nr:hypothetical protein M422DRAFT_37144 [Sphaerobolus stellatus SS14]
MFGDPDNDQALPGVLNNRKLTICAAGDNIRAGDQIIALGYRAVGSLKIMIAKVK